MLDDKVDGTEFVDRALSVCTTSTFCSREGSSDDGRKCWEITKGKKWHGRDRMRYYWVRRKLFSRVHKVQLFIGGYFVCVVEGRGIAEMIINACLERAQYVSVKIW